MHFERHLKRSIIIVELAQEITIVLIENKYNNNTTNSNIIVVARNYYVYKYSYPQRINNTNINNNSSKTQVC